MMSVAKSVRNCIVPFVFMCIAPSLAHAHGMDAAAMAPPLITSGLLAFVCYWLVMLWPASKREGAWMNGSGAAQPSEKFQTIRIKRKPRLRVIETSRQREDDQPATRRAADG